MNDLTPESLKKVLVPISLTKKKKRKNDDVRVRTSAFFGENFLLLPVLKFRARCTIILFYFCFLF